METSNRHHQITQWLKRLLFVVSGALIIIWFLYTPDGLQGKADAIGYAVCHRIASRSFKINGQPIAMCARCTGMFLGALLGIVYQSFFQHRGGMPKRLAIGIFAALAASFAVDGLNSYLHFFPGAPGLYTPQNILRLFTGTGMGLAISSVIVPIFNQTVWIDWTPEPIFDSLKPVAILLSLGVILDISILSDQPWILYPLSLLSAVGVLTLLTMIYSMIWIMLFRIENKFSRLTNLTIPLVGGFTTALLQIALIDMARYWLTGTWQGFNL